MDHTAKVHLRDGCYIDREFCSGARFSFCQECRTAQSINSEAIVQAKTPVEVTLAHCLPKKQYMGD